MTVPSKLVGICLSYHKCSMQGTSHNLYLAVKLPSLSRTAASSSARPLTWDSLRPVLGAEALSDPARLSSMILKFPGNLFLIMFHAFCGIT